MKQNRLKSLIQKKNNNGGRNNQGRITVRQRGGGHKKLYRKINFNFLSSFYYILDTEYDPNRNSLISLVRCCLSGDFFYTLLNKDIKKGSVIRSKNQIVNGGRYFLKELPSNYIISNVSLRPTEGGKFARSSGSFCKILQKDLKRGLVKLKMPSLEERYVSVYCKANVGPIFNTFKHIKKLNKAGNSRWLGRRPKVRGVAMNPIDHPHGGGEGKTSGGRPSVTPWGRITIGKKTRSRKKRASSLIVKNRKQF